MNKTDLIVQIIYIRDPKEPLFSKYSYNELKAMSIKDLKKIYDREAGKIEKVV